MKIPPGRNTSTFIVFAIFVFMLGMSRPAIGAIITNDLLRNYVASEDPDGGTDSTWEDIESSDPADDLNLSNNVTYTDAPTTTRTIAAAYDFSGGSGTTEADFEPGGDRSTSVEIWFKPDSLTDGTGAEQVLVETGGGGKGLSLSITDGGALRVVLTTGVDETFDLTSLSGSEQNDFIQAMVTVDNNGTRWNSGDDTTSGYINGSKRWSVSTGADWQGGDGLAISGFNTSAATPASTEPFDGGIAILRMYGRPLTEAEVLQNYKSYESVIPEPVSALLLFLSLTVLFLRRPAHPVVT